MTGFLLPAIFIYFATSCAFFHNIPMNRRIFLNIIIFAILTFYLLFSMVYRDVLDSQEGDLTEATPWQQPFLLPKGWQLQRLEFGELVLILNDDGQWTINGQDTSVRATKIAENWSSLMVRDISDFQEATSGQTVLAFVAETTQPIVYRILIKDNQIMIYRLNDRRRFALPEEISDVIWLTDA